MAQDSVQESLQYVKITSRATSPTRAYENSAGIDIYSAHDYKISPLGMKEVLTDIRVKLPRGTYGRIAARSGATTTKQIMIGAGVIDPDYVGNITIPVFNLSDTDCLIKAGCSFAQLICERIANPTIIKVQELPQTERGEKGFGSSET